MSSPFAGHVEKSAGRGSGGTEATVVEGEKATFGKVPGKAPEEELQEAQTSEQTPSQVLDPIQQLQQLQNPGAAQVSATDQTATPGQSDPGAEGTPPAESKLSDREALRQELLDELRAELGVDINQVKQQQQAQRLQNDALTLERIWGVNRQEVGSRLAILSQAIQNLPEASRAGFNTPEALNILWTAISASTTQQAPVWTGGTGAPAAQRSTLTQAEINAMSPEEYAARQDEVINFYRSRA